MIAENAATVKTIVKYNRSERQWQTINGTTTNFGAGPEAKRQALLAALAGDNPELFTVVTDIAAQNGHSNSVVDRLLNAASLLAHNHVYKSNRVKSQSSDDIYNVSFSGVPATYYCDCRDFENGLQRVAGLQKFGGCDVDGIGLMCKHSLAIHLAYIVDAERSDEPAIPFTQNQLVLQNSRRERIEDYLG